MDWEDVLNSFLRRLRDDRAAGRRHEVAHYQALFPEPFRARIAEEFEALAGADRPAEDEALPAEIGHFVVLRELGRGGQGRVFLARDPRLGRDVAVKLLTGLGPITPQHVQRFFREAEAASRIDHPGLCTVYETGVDGGVPYLAMRPVEGPTLEEEIARRRATGSSPADRGAVMDTVHIMEQVLRALHAAHEEGVVHRDVKPGNIVLDAEGRPVLLDFGLARLLEEDSTRLTRTGDVLGTPAYMAPEQLAEEARAVDRRTDVYAAAVTLYEALTLGRPFEAATRAGLVRAIETREPPDPRRRNPAIPADLAVVLEKALQKDPRHRYPTALAFAEDLRRVRALEQIAARPTGALVRLVRWSQREPRLAVATGGLALSLVAGLVVSSMLAVQRGRALDEAREKEQLATERLARVLRLSDLRQCEELLAEEPRLWPATEAVVPDIEDWLTRARALVDRLEVHRRDLRQLRAEALPYDEVQRRRDRAGHPRHAELVALHEHEAVHERGEPCLDVLDTPPPWDEHLADLATRRAALEAEIEAARTYAFADPAQQWRHDRLTELIGHLEALRAEDPRGPTVRGLTERLRQAATLRERSVARFADAWDAAVAAIADPVRTPAYGGLRIAPQPGLVPLGADPRSGLWEFWHVPTGERPARGADGRIELAEASGLVLVLLPGGTVRMGAQSTDPDGERYVAGAVADEAPLHDVDLDPFFLSKYEMTQAQWRRATGSNPSHYRPDKVGMDFLTLLHPVESVSWTDARSVLRHLGLDLPTEAQWEYAARAGTDTAYWWGDEPDPACLNFADRSLYQVGFDSPHVDRVLDDGFPLHAPVDALQPNPFGLHHVSGNVEELCLDGHGPYELPVRAGTGERIVFRERSRILRGGQFNNSARFARTSSREMMPVDARQPGAGVRPARRLVTAP